ncbi:hypothetical protein E4U14_003042 [Claviceps sp. LM454 group G7]|nr:hypothetical protein E4U14_003042 [Claviceps sp. LM454 group G7]
MPAYNLLEVRSQGPSLAEKLIIDEHFAHFAALRRDPIFTLKERRSVTDERQEMRLMQAYGTLYRLWTAKAAGTATTALYVMR